MSEKKALVLSGGSIKGAFQIRFEFWSYAKL